MYKFLQKIYYRYFDLRKREYKRLFKYFKGYPLILDVGCGVGDFTINDSQRIIGIDHNKRSLKTAQKRGCRVIYGDALKLPFKNNSFDGVFCAHVIEHFNSQEALILLKEINRVLKKKGRLVLETPLLHKGFYNDLTHEKVYNPEAIMHYLSRTAQTNFENIGEYEVIRLNFRHAEFFVPLLEPVRLPAGPLRTVCVLLKSLSLFLYTLGIRNYFIKNDYTLVLEKK